MAHEDGVAAADAGDAAAANLAAASGAVAESWAGGLGCLAPRWGCSFAASSAGRSGGLDYSSRVATQMAACAGEGPELRAGMGGPAASAEMMDGWGAAMPLFQTTLWMLMRA